MYTGRVSCWCMNWFSFPGHYSLDVTKSSAGTSSTFNRIVLVPIEIFSSGNTALRHHFNYVKETLKTVTLWSKLSCVIYGEPVGIEFSCKLSNFISLVNRKRTCWMSRMAYQLSPRPSTVFFICSFFAKNQNKMGKIKTLFIIHI